MSQSSRYGQSGSLETSGFDPYETHPDRTGGEVRVRETVGAATRDGEPYDGPFDDQHFVEKASLGGLFEVESSRVALEQRSSEETRKFARMMIEDHGKSHQELASLAARKNLRASTTLDLVHEEKLDELRRLEGAELDRKYRQCQIKAHDEAIALFERAARDCRDPELKAFAARTLPTLRAHRGHLTSPAIESSQRGEIQGSTGSGSPKN